MCIFLFNLLVLIGLKPIPSHFAGICPQYFFYFFSLQYPEGYLESLAEKDKAEEDESSSQKKGKKRKAVGKSFFLI